MPQKTMTSADLAIHIEGCLGLTATAAETAVKLLFRICETALAHSGTGESVGIGFGSLRAVPGRHNEAGTWRPAFGPSRTFLQYLDRLQARACAGENLGAPFPRMVRKDLVDLLVGRGIRRALADRVVKATVTFWCDRLVMGCAVELPGGLAQVTWKCTARVRRQAGGALRRGNELVWAQRSRRRGDGPKYWLGVSFRSNRQFRSAGLGRVDIVRIQPDRSHLAWWVPGAAPPVHDDEEQQQSGRPPVRVGFLDYGEELSRRRAVWLSRMSRQANP